MAEESWHKREVAKSSLRLQELYLLEQVQIREEQIMSRYLSQLDEVSQRFYELKERQLLWALEQDIDKDGQRVGGQRGSGQRKLNGQTAER
jgi:hypothetical protein